MKRILIAGAFALAAGGQALAADLPPPVAPPPRAPATYVPAPVPYYNWGGIYIGINGGYGFSFNNNWSGTGPTGASGSTATFNTNGFLLGGTIGANYQAGPWVFGIEADGDWSGISGSTGTGDPGCLTTVLGASSCKTTVPWLGTVRGRVGWAFDRVLFFGTAGGAFSDIQAVTNLATNSNTEFGWTAGAGIEVGITPNWTAKVEYLFVDFQNGSCTTACTPAGSPATASVNVKMEESLVRAGLNYKFSF